MKSSSYISKIEPNGAVTLPKDIRNELGLRKGSYVMLSVLNNLLVIMKINKNFYELTKRMEKAKKKIEKSNINEGINWNKLAGESLKEVWGNKKDSRVWQKYL